MKALWINLLAFVGIKPLAPQPPSVQDPGVSVQKVEEKGEAPLLGGYQEMDLKSAVQFNDFIQSNVNGIEGFKLISYKKQVVNGFNHKLTYEDAQGNRRAVILYENIDGSISITDDSSVDKTI